MTVWKNIRPEWCPHSDCIFLMSPQALMCVGRLPKLEKHDLGCSDGCDGHFNTHRWCLDTRETGHGIFDLQVNRGDLYAFGILFDAVRADLKQPGRGADHD